MPPADPAPAPPPPPPPTIRRRLAAIPPGLRYMAISAFWFSLMSLLVKLAGRALPSMEVVMVRAVLTLGLAYAAVRHARLHPWGTHRSLLVLRGLLGATALSCFYFSLVHLPLGEATVIQYTNPLWATVLAALLLKERIGRRALLCLAGSLAGVLLIARPGALFGFGEALPLGTVGIALFGAACSGAAYVVVRRIGRREHRLVVVFYLPLVTFPITVPFVSDAWRWPTPWEWLLLVGVAVTTHLGQVSMTRGLQLERAGRATAVGYLQIAFAALWGVLLLGERPDLFSVAGAAVIVGSTWLLVRGPHEPAGVAGNMTDVDVEREVP